MDFTTKIAQYDVTVHRGLVDDCSMEGAFNVEWQYYAEFRGEYIKEVGVYATRVIGVVFEDDEAVFEKDRQEIDSEDEGWSLKSDSSNIQWGDWY